ncbi:MAG: GTP-binding protein [Candidatus Lokiarchaeota archaeon]|nr:GTP-binding protein [Candidatus Lokiarchaeota archaeon]
MKVLKMKGIKKRLKNSLNAVLPEFGGLILGYYINSGELFSFSLFENHESKISKKKTVLSSMKFVLDKIKNQAEKFGMGYYDTENFRFFIFQSNIGSFFVLILVKAGNYVSKLPLLYLLSKKVSNILNGNKTNQFLPKINDDSKERKLKLNPGILHRIRIPSGEYAYKIVLNGEQGAGATTLGNFFDKDYEIDYMESIGTCVFKKEFPITILNTMVRLVIWNIADGLEFKRVRQAYIEHAEGAILLFDSTSRESFINLKYRYNEIKVISPNTIVILVANKIDLKDRREISPEEGKKMANELGCFYAEISAKTGENVVDTLEFIAIELIKNFIVLDNLS